MPTYEYQCKNCGHHLEELQSFSEPPLVRCPKCGTDNLMRVMGTGALIFKGNGFYQTDYKNQNSTGGETKKKEKEKDKAKENAGGKESATPAPVKEKESKGDAPTTKKE